MSDRVRFYVWDPKHRVNTGSTGLTLGSPSTPLAHRATRAKSKEECVSQLSIAVTKWYRFWVHQVFVQGGSKNDKHGQQMNGEKEVYQSKERQSTHIGGTQKDWAVATVLSRNFYLVFGALLGQTLQDPRNSFLIGGPLGSLGDNFLIGGLLSRPLSPPYHEPTSTASGLPVLPLFSYLTSISCWLSLLFCGPQPKLP
jgi:hypothetical protein